MRTTGVVVHQGSYDRMWGVVAVYAAGAGGSEQLPRLFCCVCLFQ